MICDNCIHQNACVTCYASMGYLYDPKYNFDCELKCKCFEDKSKYEEVRHGKWIEDNDGVTRCSCCGNKANRNYYVNVQELSEFCPNCGANMNNYYCLWD